MERSEARRKLYDLSLEIGTNGVLTVLQDLLNELADYSDRATFIGNSYAESANSIVKLPNGKPNGDLEEDGEGGDDDGTS